MGFYLRRSVRLGPIRLNLSKSGLGISAGVTGARIGVNANGRAYLHGGRYGLYYRKSLSGSAARSRPRPAPGTGPLPPQEIEVPTDATYPAEGTIAAADPTAEPLVEEAPATPAPETRWLWPGIAAAVGVVLWLGATGASGSAAGALLLATSIGFGAARSLRARAGQRALGTFQRRIAALLERAPLPDPATLDRKSVV